MHDEQKHLQSETKIPPFRKVSPNSGIAWLTQAFELFKQNPLTWLSSLIVMFILLILIMLMPVIQFFSIVLTPVFTAGLMIGCNNLRHNRPFRIAHLFSGFKQNFNALLIVGLIYLGYILVCSFLAVELAAYAGKPLMQVTPEMLTSGTLDIQAFLESLLLPTLILMGLMLPIFMATWFAPALVILRNVKAILAIQQSFLACSQNMKAFTIYGLVAFVAMFLLVILVSLISALIPGLAILIKLLSNLFFMSILVASMFTSFEDIFPPNVKSELKDNQDETEVKNSSDNDDGPSSIIL